VPSGELRGGSHRSLISEQVASRIGTTMSEMVLKAVHPSSVATEPKTQPNLSEALSVLGDP
jgi:hypothetical protein